MGEGSAIPVKDMSFSSQTLTRHKLAVITTMTEEIIDASNGAIESVVRQGILDDTAEGLDALLMDTTAGSATRPAGLLNGISAGTSAGDTAANIITDVKALLAAITTGDESRNLRLLIHPDRLLGARCAINAVGVMQFADEIARGTLLGIPYIESSNVASDEVHLVNVSNLATGYDGPMFQMSNTATLHMEDTSPTAIGTAGTPNVVAAPVRSLFQTDSLAIRTILPLTWALLRTGQIHSIGSVSW